MSQVPPPKWDQPRPRTEEGFEGAVQPAVPGRRCAKGGKGAACRVINDAIGAVHPPMHTDRVGPALREEPQSIRERLAWLRPPRFDEFLVLLLLRVVRRR